MTNESIKVRTIETKTSQKGNTYYTITLEDGRNASAFDSNLVEELRKAMNDNFVVEVDLEQSGAFLNIRPKRSENKTQTKLQAEKPVAKGFDSNAMYVAYAKDMFGVMFVELFRNTQNKEGLKPLEIMDTCIKLVKQAKEGLQ